MGVRDVYSTAFPVVAGRQTLSVKNLWCQALAHWKSMKHPIVPDDYHLMQ
jgi:hypothetical protein